MALVAVRFLSTLWFNSVTGAVMTGAWEGMGGEAEGREGGEGKVGRCGE